MSLASAVVIATSHTISTTHANAYLQYMIDYLNGIKELFPKYKLHPNHHMALHIHEYLLLFAPVHCWWTFPFEQMIGALQRMPHNNKTGELVVTGPSRLHGILLKTGCPDIIRHCESIFHKLVDPQIRDSIQTDIQSLGALLKDENDVQHVVVIKQTMHLLPTELCLTFQHSQIEAPPSGYFLSNFSICGLTYSTFSKHHGNACIMIKAPNDAKPVPAKVAHSIEFSIEGMNKTYLAVQRHKPVTLHHDPFSQYPILQAQLWETQLSNLEIVMLGQISLHCAQLPVEIGHEKYVAVLSLCCICAPPTCQSLD
ncbi:hypothetical protein BU17DRAFT_91293 [Hysterangium stoloniferum]|nr:hypothetical protein BU17DRAFT_91293 [Hysterangium stoloniferum]